MWCCTNIRTKSYDFYFSKETLFIKDLCVSDCISWRIYVNACSIVELYDSEVLRDPIPIGCIPLTHKLINIKYNKNSTPILTCTALQGDDNKNMGSEGHMCEINGRWIYFAGGGIVIDPSFTAPEEESKLKPFYEGLKEVKYRRILGK